MVYFLPCALLSSSPYCISVSCRFPSSLIKLKCEVISISSSFSLSLPLRFSFFISSFFRSFSLRLLFFPLICFFLSPPIYCSVVRCVLSRRLSAILTMPSDRQLLRRLEEEREKKKSDKDERKRDG